MIPFSSDQSAIIIIAMLGSTITGQLSHCMRPSCSLNSTVPAGAVSIQRARTKLRPALIKNEAVTNQPARFKSWVNALCAPRSARALSTFATSIT